MSAGVRREERDLLRIFRRARWLALAAPALPLACGAEDPLSGGSGRLAPQPEDTSSRGGAGGGEPGEAPVAEVEPLAASCAPQSFSPDPPDRCGDFVRLPCGLPAGVVPGSRCYLWLNDCKKVCPGFYFNCHAVNDSCVDGKIVADAQGGIDIDCSTCPGSVGRVPAGLARVRIARAPSALGDHFAVAAHLEAASVHAFRRLRGELAAHRAPARLLLAARRAQRDEVRHARLTGRMARRFGGVGVSPRVEPLPPRALDAVAIENAVEGCVRETFGALVASWQAAHARDPEIARLMKSIARDETRHAALSWAVARWAWARLDQEARARLAERCRAAIASLRCQAHPGVAGELVTRAGLPDAAQHRALVGALEEGLWGGWARV
jgi:hypothetical protein